MILRATGNVKLIDVDGHVSQIGRNTPASTLNVTQELMLNEEEIKLKAQLKSEFPLVFETGSKSQSRDKLTVHEYECPCNPQGPVKPQTFPCALTRDLPQLVIERTIDECSESGSLGKASADEVDFVSPTMFVRKPSSAEEIKVRLIADLREISCCFPTRPSEGCDVQSLLNRIPSSWNFYAKIDLANAFWSVQIREPLRRRSGIVVNGQNYRTCSLPHGFSFGPILFQRRIEAVLAGTRALAYLDDVLTGGEDVKSLASAVRTTFSRLSDHGLKINEGNLQILRTSVDLLGVHLTHGQYDLSRHANERIQKLPQIRSVRDLRQAVGGPNFVRDFVPPMDVILNPPHRAMKEAKNRRMQADWWAGITEAVLQAWKLVQERNFLAAGFGNEFVWTLYRLVN